MGFSTYAIPSNVSIVDTMQTYATGSSVGSTVGVDDWEVTPAGNGMAVQTSVYCVLDGAVQGVAIVGGFNYAAHKDAISENHWVAAQTIVPLEYPGGVFPGARVNPSNGDGYFLRNWGYTENPADMMMDLIVRKNGVARSVGAWVLSAGTANEQYIDGVFNVDAFFSILEVAGTNPVSIRVSIASAISEGRFTTYPTAIPLGTSGNQASEVVWEGELTDPNYIVTGGKPGFYATEWNPAGGAYNFNAGEVTGYVADASMGTLSLTAGATLGLGTLSGPSGAVNASLGTLSLTASSTLALGTLSGVEYATLGTLALTAPATLGLGALSGVVTAANQIRAPNGDVRILRNLDGTIRTFNLMT